MRDRRIVECSAFLHQHALDVVVVQELAQYLESLCKVLINKVDGGVRNPCSVSSDGVCDVPNADGVQVFAILSIQSLLDEALRVQVVVVSCNKNVNVSHNLKHVKSLL